MMVSRRLKAVFDVVIGVVSLKLIFRIRAFLDEHADDVEEEPPEPFSPKGLVLGAVVSILNTYLSDLDVFGIRTNWRRRLLFSFLRRAEGKMLNRLLTTTDSFELSYSIGGLYGMIAYRLWYGVLRPLPDPRSGNER